MPVSSTTTGSLIALLLGSGVLSSALTLGGTAYLAKRAENRRAKKARAYSALRVAVGLEEFAGKCAELIESYSMRGEPYGGPDRMPSFPTFAPDVEWREMDIAIAAKALSLENLIRITDHGLASSELNFGASVAEAECRDRCAVLGAEAWELALRLRKTSGLEPLGEQLPWNYPRLLQREATATRERLARFHREQFGAKEPGS